MKVLSLFDGISCGMVALERAGITVEQYDAFEIEPSAIKISQQNYPGIIHHGDVTKSNFEEYKGYDLLIGGSPCVELSIVKSKKRLNLGGESALFYDFVRALETVQPRYFIFENVASMSDESKNIISGALHCEPIYINSADFSAQDRPRLYWTNIPILPWKPLNLTINDILQTDVPDKYWYNKDFEIIDENKKICGIINFNTHELNKRLYNTRFTSPTLTCINGGYHEKKIFIDGRARKLTPLEYERLQTLPDNYTAGVSDTKRYSACGNGWTVDVIAHILKGIN